MRCPTDRVLTIADADYRVATCERLGVHLAEVLCERVFARIGRVCGACMRGGHHVHCCPGLSGVRTSMRHHRLVWEWCHILRLAGRAVYVEQRDPTMGANAKLDLVEYIQWALRESFDPTVLAEATPSRVKCPAILLTFSIVAIWTFQPAVCVQPCFIRCFSSHARFASDAWSKATRAQFLCKPGLSRTTTSSYNF